MANFSEALAASAKNSDLLWLSVAGVLGVGFLTILFAALRLLTMLAGYAEAAELWIEL